LAGWQAGMPALQIRSSPEWPFVREDPTWHRCRVALCLSAAKSHRACRRHACVYSVTVPLGLSPCGRDGREAPV